MKRQNDTILIALTAFSGLLVMIAIYLALLGAPDANLQSETGRFAQRIIYFHIATAWVGFLAFFVTFVAGIGYLRTQGRKWDIVALSSAEIGTVFMLGVLISGSIWAKPAWGVWWVWDERLTISLIQFLIYVGYLMLRTSVEDPSRKARFAAVYGIVAFISVPINFIAIRMWRTQHPLMFGDSGGGLGPNMMFAFFFSLLTFTVWYVTLMWHRVRLERSRDDVEQLKQQLMDLVLGQNRERFWEGTMGYLAAAYAVLWAISFGLVFSMVFRQRKLDSDLQSLRVLIDDEMGPEREA